MYGRGELLVVHAIGLAVSRTLALRRAAGARAGGTRPYELDQRLAGPRAGRRAAARAWRCNTAVPLVLRGRGEVDTWAPSALPDPSADLVARVRAHVRRRCRARDRRSSARAPCALERRAMSDAATMTAGDGGGGARAQAIVVWPAAPASSCRSPTARRRPCSRSAAGTRTRTRSNPKGALANSLRAARCRPGGAARRLRGSVVAAHGGRRRHRVRPRSRRQRHARHRPWHAAASPSCSAARCTAAASSPIGRAGARRERFEGRDLRTTTDLRARLQGRAGRSPAGARRDARGRRVSGQRRDPQALLLRA